MSIVYRRFAFFALEFKSRKMRKKYNSFVKLFYTLFFVATVFVAFAQENTINNEVVSFKKRELNSGFVFDVSNQQDKSDEINYNNEETSLSAKFRFENSFYNLLDYKQEELNAAFEIGPFGGFDEWEYDSGSKNVNANQNFFGISSSANVSYLNRFYYDPKNFTVFDISAWGRYDLYQLSSDSTIVTSGATNNYDESETKDQFSYGFDVKAGWGVGRLSPMNHLMTAHYLLEKYYPGRVFSDFEIAELAQVVAEIKNNRDLRKGHKLEEEMSYISSFMSNKLLLAPADAMQDEWQYSEFDPRYEGKRLEFGPYFTYSNQEPDFVYGGYVQYENSKYRNVKWNRNFSAEIVYHRYEDQDWGTAELDLGWTYFPNLKNQFDFGVKYVSGIEIDGLDNLGTLSHNAIPYAAWYTQFNSKSRMKMNLAWRIADGEQFVLPGPEFSLAIYRSRY